MGFTGVVISKFLVGLFDNLFKKKAELVSINIPRELAETIIKMEEVCFSNGSGPDSGDLLKWIANEYPDLPIKYNYLDWGDA